MSNSNPNGAKNCLNKQFSEKELQERCEFWQNIKEGIVAVSPPPFEPSVEGEESPGEEGFLDAVQMDHTRHPDGEIFDFSDRLPQARTAVIPGHERRRFPYSAIGKLYWVRPGPDNGKRFGTAWCVTGKNRNGLITAAHCLFDTRQYQPVENMIFVPFSGEEGGAFKNCYVVNRTWILNGYSPSRSRFVNGLDLGALTVQPKEGQKDLHELTGTLGWRTGKPCSTDASETVFAFGYPINLARCESRTYKFDGKNLWMNRSGRLRCRPIRPPEVNLCFNPLLRGASGGPWLRAHGNRISAIGIHAALNCGQGYKNMWTGPQFGEGFINLMKVLSL